MSKYGWTCAWCGTFHIGPYAQSVAEEREHTRACPQSPFNRAMAMLDERGKAILLARRTELIAVADNALEPGDKPLPENLVVLVKDIMDREGVSGG